MRFGRCNHRAIVVDDAHLKPEFLTALHHLRREIHADFRLLVNCWPNRGREVKSNLQIAEQSVWELPLLTQDEIVEVINSTGFRPSYRVGPRDRSAIRRSPRFGCDAVSFVPHW